MTKLVLEIPSQKDLDVLLPLFERLKIRFSSLESVLAKSSNFDLTDDELEALDRIVAEFEADPTSGVDAFQFMKTPRVAHVA